MKQTIAENFKFGILNGGPTITFKLNESSERSLFLHGVKNDVKEETISAWLQKNLGIALSAQNIHIKKITPKVEANVPGMDKISNK